MDVLYQESSSLKYESLGLDMPRVFEAMGYGNNVPDDKIIGIANGIMEKVSEKYTECIRIPVLIISRCVSLIRTGMRYSMRRIEMTS